MSAIKPRAEYSACQSHNRHSERRPPISMGGAAKEYEACLFKKKKNPEEKRIRSAPPQKLATSFLRPASLPCRQCERSRSSTVGPSALNHAAPSAVGLWERAHKLISSIFVLAHRSLSRHRFPSRPERPTFPAPASPEELQSFLFFPSRPRVNGRRPSRLGYRAPFLEQTEETQFPSSRVFCG